MDEVDKSNPTFRAGNVAENKNAEFSNESFLGQREYLLDQKLFVYSKKAFEYKMHPSCQIYK